MFLMYMLSLSVIEGIGLDLPYRPTRYLFLIQKVGRVSAEVFNLYIYRSVLRATSIGHSRTVDSPLRQSVIIII